MVRNKLVLDQEKIEELPINSVIRQEKISMFKIHKPKSLLKTSVNLTNTNKRNNNGLGNIYLRDFVKGLNLAEETRKSQCN
jgi:hypothetical protein